MKRFHTLVAALVIAALPAAPAFAGWKIAAHGVSTAVAKGTLKVTPGEDWNRSSSRPIKKSEVWTLDGSTLNELYFVSGLAAGETLLRDVDKRNRPLPKMNGSMQLTDIPEFFESSWRVALGTTLFEMGAMEPARLGGRDAVKFAYTYSVQGETMLRKGVAVGTIVDRQLHLINFVAPSIHFFDRDAPKAEAVFASARL